MAPGRAAVWPSRCAVCLLVAVGAALGPASGPLGGTAHGSSADEGRSATTTPFGASSPAAALLPPDAAPSPEPLSALPLPSGVAGPADVGPVGSPSADASYADAAESSEGSAAPSPSRSASVEVSGSTAPLAGREAGAGKARPGRSPTPLELTRAETPVEPEAPGEPTGTVVDLPVLTPPPEASSEPGPPAAHALDAAAVRQVQQLSLGAGIALVGLGLGFLAFRLRRVH